MLRELISSNVFVFTSELYAQVTAGVIITSAGAVVIDAMPFPVETRQIAHFIEERYGVPVRYVINTHYHADHTYGTYLFKDARVISHRLCRELLDGRGREALEKARRTSREIAPVELRLPDVTFDEGRMNLHLGTTTLQMWLTPGHSPDSIVCLLKDERILFAGDTLMPIPFFADGDWESYVSTLEALSSQAFECIVQGHGEVILRGEVKAKIEQDLHYLHTLRAKVEKLIKRGDSPESVAKIDIESCGKSRISLNGLVERLHHSNAVTLYWALKKEQAKV